VVSRRGEDRIRRGHPWIYKSDVMSATAAPGDLVTVAGGRGRRLGEALWSSRSQIALRMVSVGDEPHGEGIWRHRLAEAIAFRDGLHIDATAYRIVHGEADRLPSLIVDKYGDYLVVQTLSQGTDRRLPELASALVELVAPAGILARNDPKVRTLEGLEQNVQVVHGEVPSLVQVREGAVEYRVDLWHGQKTGLFLDQRENRIAATGYARGRLLDCFSYNGAFALALARHCTEVLAIDASTEAVARIAENAAANRLANVSAREANVFDELRHFEQTGDRFNTIVLDPPAFAKNKTAVEKALAGYKDINLRALRILEPGGVLVSCSCSYNVDEPMFLQVLAEAAADARAHVTILEKRMQGRDHPVLLTVPETYYLKCVILRKH
jgi:23S rRNA (cytosine1962-C5)-methyltransferase